MDIYLRLIQSGLLTDNEKAIFAGEIRREVDLELEKINQEEVKRQSESMVNSPSEALSALLK